MTRRLAPADLSERLAKDREAALRIVPVSRETEDRLAALVELLARWRKATNLISESSFASVWTRHVADSAQLLGFAPDARRWLDIGSGAGFPGLVIAILLANVPGAVVYCVESDRRKCAFLREAARATGSPVEIHAARVEILDPASIGAVDAVTARAFAPLPLTLGLTNVWLRQGAIGLFPRGRSVEEQLASLTATAAYKVEVIPSLVDAESGILRIRAASGRTP